MPKKVKAKPPSNFFIDDVETKCLYVIAECVGINPMLCLNSKDDRVYLFPGCDDVYLKIEDALHWHQEEVEYGNCNSCELVTLLEETIRRYRGGTLFAPVPVNCGELISSRRIDGFRNDLAPYPASRLTGSIVYAITDGHGIKLGKSNDHPQNRLRELQVGNSNELQLVAYDFQLIERQVHSKLQNYRIRGEWFKRCPEVLTEIETWCWLDTGIWQQMWK